jgi:acyl carrier protein
MADTWRNVLEPKSSEKDFVISLDDNFFDLGGNSLHAIKLITIINKTFQIKIPLQFIYENPFLK